MHVPFGIDLDGLGILHQLFMEGVKNGMSSSVGGETGPGLGVAAETSLGDFSVRPAAEHTTEMFQFINDTGSGLHIFLHRILVAEEVSPFDRVVHMFFPAVRLRVPERCGDTPLGSTGM